MRVLKRRGGTIGALFVKVSHQTKVMSVATPTASKAIVAGELPTSESQEQSYVAMSSG